MFIFFIKKKVHLKIKRCILLKQLLPTQFLYKAQGNGITSVGLFYLESIRNIQKSCLKLKKAASLHIICFSKNVLCIWGIFK